LRLPQVLIACWDDVPEEAELRKLLTGRATRLQSQFRLTYSMILNLLRVEDLKARPKSRKCCAVVQTAKGPQRLRKCRRAVAP
jgi:superfamily II RNA helicase